MMTLAARLWIAVLVGGVGLAGLDRHAGMDGGTRRSSVQVDPAGRLWMGDHGGNAFVCDSFGGGWAYSGLRHVCRPDNPDCKYGDEFLPNIERIRFFDDRTGVASGYIGSERKDQVYVTRDGGRSWDRVSFGADMWVYGWDVWPDGHVWMVGSSGDLVRSTDSGRTWTKLTPPFDASSRSKCVVMLDVRHGLVSALGNGLKRTRDGGKTWTAVPTQKDQGFGKDRSDHCDHRLEVERLGSKLIAYQCGAVCWSDSRRIRWTALPRPMPRGVIDDAHRRFVGVDGAGRLVALDENLAVEVLADRVPVLGLGVSCATANAVYLEDEGEAVHRWSKGSWTVQPPVMRDDLIETPGNIAASPGLLWGWSGHHVYGSADHGASWFRIAYSSGSITSLLPLGDDAALIADQRGNNRRVLRSTGAVEPISALIGYDIRGMLRRGDRIALFGGYRHETLRAPTVARTTFSGQYAGSRPEGFTIESRDRGQTWKQVDTWAGAGVADAYLSPSGTLTLYSYRGALRRLTPSGASYLARDVLAANPRIGGAPYVEFPGALWFRSDDEGFLSGEIHHAGRHAYRTLDGGVSWIKASGVEWPYDGTTPAGDADLAWNHAEVALLRGFERESIFTLPPAPLVLRPRAEPTYEPEPRVSSAIFEPSSGEVTVTIRSGTWRWPSYRHRRFRRGKTGWVEQQR